MSGEGRRGRGSQGGSEAGIGAYLGACKHWLPRTAWAQTGGGVGLAAGGRVGLGIQEKLCPRAQGVSIIGCSSATSLGSHTAQNTQCAVSGAHSTDQATEVRGGGSYHVSVLSFRARSLRRPTSQAPTVTQGPGLPAYLDPLDALGDDIGMVHGHQRDLDSSHPAHGVRPHACRRRGDGSALPAPAGGTGPGARGSSARLWAHLAPLERPGLGSSQRGRSGARTPFPPAQLTTQGVWMVPCSVSTAATRLTPKSSVRTRMPVTGQFSMTWGERETKGTWGSPRPHPDGT